MALVWYLEDCYCIAGNYYNGRIFLCKMDRTKIKRTNQPEMAQNEIWTRRKFPTIRYAAAEISAVTVEHTHTYN